MGILIRPLALRQGADEGAVVLVERLALHDQQHREGEHREIDKEECRVHELAESPQLLCAEGGPRPRGPGARAAPGQLKAPCRAPRGVRAPATAPGAAGHAP